MKKGNGEEGWGEGGGGREGRFRGSVENFDGKGLFRTGTAEVVPRNLRKILLGREDVESARLLFSDARGRSSSLMGEMHPVYAGCGRADWDGGEKVAEAVDGVDTSQKLTVDRGPTRC